MIQYYPSFLTNEECNQLINLYDTSEGYYWEDDKYRFYSIELNKNKIGISKFDNFSFDRFRVQMVDESVNQVLNFHIHRLPWSFVIFLNQNFEGGELVFENNTYSPKTGDMVYFSGDEPHKVNNCIGNRYTLVGFLNNNPMMSTYNNII